DVVRRGAGRPRELPGVGVETVQRVDVHHLDVDVLVFVAGLERLTPGEPRVVDLGVVERRVLPLRVRRLAAELRVPRDALRREAAGDPRIARQPGEPEGVLRARRAEAGRVLPRL